MRILSFFILFLFSLIVVQAQESRNKSDLIVFQDSAFWGFKNSSGKIVIEAKYRMAFDFSPDGIAAVIDSSGWKFINKKGKNLLTPFTFDNGPDYFEEDVARCIEDDKIGFFNRKGEIVIQPKYTFATSFHEGLSAFCVDCEIVRRLEHYSVKGGKWGYMNKKGEEVIPPIFDGAGFFKEGKAKVKQNGTWVYINAKGELVEKE
ncbi:MAG: hypothetical protein CSA05_01320 [Bacteroidia bacterium]|nr:MAG: hypothetical protein CSA05_01320 [Bacteroidia bacterium]